MSNTPETDELDRELHAPKVLQDRYNEMREHAQKLECERDKVRNYCKATWQSLRDSQDEVLRLTVENRELRRELHEIY